MMPLSPKSRAPLGIYDHGGVSSDGPLCSEVARDILKEGGSVADAAIGGLLCLGVIHAHSAGIGGGFLSVMHISGKTEILNAREVAPLAATEDMYVNNPVDSIRGGKSVAVPGEMKGYWELYKKHGRLPWKRLFEPAIKLCRDGFHVTEIAAGAFARVRHFIIPEESLSEIFVNPSTGDVWVEGDFIKRPKLANTLEIIANSPNGGDSFYEGEIADNFIQDLKSFGGIITHEDLQEYSVKWEEPIELQIHGGYKLITGPVPSSGILVGFILRVLGGNLDIPKSIEEYTQVWQRIIESFKYAYAKRSILGDVSMENKESQQQIYKLIHDLQNEEFTSNIGSSLLDSSTHNTAEYYGAEFHNSNENHGTGQISILGENGDSITVTTSINLHFGGKIRSKSTGIIYNNEMDDFSTPNQTNTFGIPPSRNNFIKPKKRPMSSMCPVIFLDDKGHTRLVLGGAGGSKITTGTAIVSIFNLWFNMNIRESIDERRLHHQLFPMEVSVEKEFNEDIIKSLEVYGHKISDSTFGSFMCGVEKSKDGKIKAAYDFRKTGSVAGY